MGSTTWSVNTDLMPDTIEKIVDRAMAILTEPLEKEVAKQFALVARADFPSWVLVVPGGDNQVALIAPARVPIHWIKPQSELVAQRGRRVVLSNGEVVPRGFHNPIVSGDAFHVAWQRVGKASRPIRFVLDSPVPYITGKLGIA